METLDWLQAAAGAAVALFVWLAATAAFLSRSSGKRLERERRMLLPIAAAPRADRRLAAVRERRYFLERKLAGGEAPRLELFEQPEWLPPVARRELSDGEAEAQAAALHWQLKSDEWLLGGRVADLMVAFSRRRDDLPRPLATEIRLEGRFEDGAASNGDFLAVIATDRISEVARAVHEAGDWLGTAVAVAPPRKIEPYGVAGQCSRPGGGRGCIGAAMRIADWHCNDHLLTADHVVAADCPMAVERPNFAGDETFEPDAALLCAEEPCACFAVAGLRPARPVSIHPSDARALRRSGALRRVPGRSPRGRYFDTSLNPHYDGRSYHFPHAMIVADPADFLDILLPPYKFARKGHSGSAVVAENGALLGLVVAGYGFARITYAVLAEPLVDLWSCRMSPDTRPIPIQAVLKE